MEIVKHDSPTLSQEFTCLTQMIGAGSRRYHFVPAVNTSFQQEAQLWRGPWDAALVGFLSFLQREDPLVS